MPALALMLRLSFRKRLLHVSRRNSHSSPCGRCFLHRRTLARRIQLSNANGVFMIRLLAVLGALMLAAPAFAQKLPANLDKANAIVIDTTKGRVVVQLRTALAPHHAERIKQLARDGYYNNVPFHRVIEGFMAQTGCGNSYDGTGSSKYPSQQAEFSNVPITRGVVGMERS